MDDHDVVAPGGPPLWLTMNLGFPADMTVLFRGRARSPVLDLQAARLLAMKYELVITNTPYLGRGNQGEILQEFCSDNYPSAKQNLANVMLERCLKLVGNDGGVVQFVMPQNWLFQPRYENHRRFILVKSTILSLAKLGPGAFETISGEVEKAALVSIVKSKASDDARFSIIDLTSRTSIEEKIEELLRGPLALKSISAQSANHQSVITTETIANTQLLNSRARAWQGLVTGDDNRFVFRNWEVSCSDERWHAFQQAPQKTALYTGLTDVLLWEGGAGQLKAFPGAHNFQPSRLIGKIGIAVQRVKSLLS